MTTSTGDRMTPTLLDRPIGYRADGRPIHLAYGAEPDPDPAPQPAPAPALTPGPPPSDGWAPPSREDWERTQAQLRQLMTAGATPPPAASGDEPDDDEDDDGKTPKPADAETAKLRKALRAANAESKARREQADRLKAEWDAAEQQRAQQLEEAKRLSEAADKARQEAEARYKPATIKAAALPAFMAAGADHAAAPKLLRLLDMSGLDLDESGAVTGLTEQVEAIKADFPAMFAPAEPDRPRPPRLSGADRPPTMDAPTRSADQLAASVLRPRT